MKAPPLLLARLLCCAALGGLCCVGLTGCNLAAGAGVASYKLFGPPAVDPVYVPTAEPMLVLVENYRNPAGASPDAEQVAQFVTENLKANIKNEKDKPPKLVLVDQEKLLELQNGRPAEFRKMKIPQVGKALGARQVLYVDLLASGVEMTPGSELLRGRFMARVKIVDVETGQNRWPSDMAEGYPVTWENKPQRPGDKVYPSTVREQALRVGANRVARLFYKWKPQDLHEDEESL